MGAAQATIEDRLSILAEDGFCADAYEEAIGQLSLLLPPERLSTTECAVKYRYMKNPEGDGKRLWSLNRTPYMKPVQDALDNPRYRMVIVVGPERSGKALDVETPIATPSGWATMGDLSVGDVVFAADGSPTRVTAVSDIQVGRECLAVRFSDGAEIVCDKEHLWEVIHSPWGGDEQQAVKVLEAQHLEPIAFRQTAKGIVNCLAVDVAGALDLPEVDLPIPPYTLGAWLGDGTARTGDITLHARDSQTLSEIGKDGFRVKIKSKPRPGNLTVSILTDASDEKICARGHDLSRLGRYKDDEYAGRVKKGRCVACARMDALHFRDGRSRQNPQRRDTFRARLEAAGLVGNKHVPSVYLRSSKDQRLALLQGWMDTDGYIDSRTSRCELVTVEPHLAVAALELVRSLGLKPTMQRKEAYAVVNGKRTRGRDAYRVCFMAYSDVPVFRLERKLARQKSRPIRNKHTARRRIVSISPVPSRPVRCIRVDNERHLFLAGRELIPTHNSVGGENYLLRCLRNGPLTDTIIYLQAGADCDSYADKEFTAFIELHPEIETKLGKSSSDRKRRHKKFAGRSVQILPANDNNLRQKEAPLIIATEIDGMRTARKIINEIRGRQKAFGNQAKSYIESHPDLGWEVGITPGWKSGTRGIPYWQCPHCECWSTPHQLAPSGMRATMHYERDDSLADHERLTKAINSAAVLCPHNGCMISDDERYSMIDGLVIIHTGQEISVHGEITGEPIDTDTASFWFHGLNVKRPIGPLVREHLEATVHFERTRKPDALKRFLVKSLGEVYEGAGSSSRRLDPDKLEERATGDSLAVNFQRGTVPPGFRFVVAAVDVGGRKFDSGFWAFDLEGRSALIERLTTTDVVLPDGSRRDIRPPENIEDWMQLREIVIGRSFPLADNPDLRLPVACTVIDTGGSGTRDKNDVPDGVTYKAREFARRMARAGEAWGGWHKVKLIKGFHSKEDKEILAKRDINTDEHGKTVTPKIIEFNLNVDRLKALSSERLLVDDHGPGRCYFAQGLPRSVFAEMSAEVLIDGKWERHGANETFDLFGYAEAGRIMLDPDRADIRWDSERLPPWATPIRAEEIKPEATKPQSAIQAPQPEQSVLERFAALGGN